MKNRSNLLFVLFVLAAIVVACTMPSNTATEEPSSEDQVATIVAGTMQALTPVVAESTPESQATELLPRSFYYLGTDNSTGLTQVFRIDRDGMTMHQVTREPVNVNSYDVSLADGSVAYVSNNQLLWVDVNGAGRRLLVDGGPVDQINPFVSTLSKPVFSPDGKTIAYSYKGLNFFSIDTGVSNLVIENQVDDLGNNAIFPKELYSPDSYSPDGTKLLVTLGYYEGASSAIYIVASNTLVRLTGDDNAGALICCGNTQWTADSSAIYSANSSMGMFVAGLWKVDVSNGQVSTLFTSSYDGNVFNYARDPYLAPDGQLYYFYLSSTSETQGRTPLQLVRSAADGITNRRTLRPDSFELLNEALWAPDAGFVVVAFAPIQDVYFGGQAEVTYLDGRPSVILTTFAQEMKWGP